MKKKHYLSCADLIFDVNWYLRKLTEDIIKDAHSKLLMEKQLIEFRIDKENKLILNFGYLTYDQGFFILYPKFENTNKLVSDIERILDIKNIEIEKNAKKIIKQNTINSDSVLKMITTPKFNFNVGYDYMLIYTDIVKYHHVSDRFLPIIKVVPLTKFGTFIIEKEYNNIDYYKVNQSEIRSIHISFFDDKGHKFSAINSPIHMTLHFKNFNLNSENVEK